MSVTIDLLTTFHTTEATVTETVGTDFVTYKHWNIRVLNYHGRQPECHWQDPPTTTAIAYVDQHFGACEHIIDNE